MSKSDQIADKAIKYLEDKGVAFNRILDVDTYANGFPFTWVVKFEQISSEGIVNQVHVVSELGFISTQGLDDSYNKSIIEKKCKESPKLILTVICLYLLLIFMTFFSYFKSGNELIPIVLLLMGVLPVTMPAYYCIFYIQRR